MKNKTKKIVVSIILGIYILTNFLQSGLYTGNSVYAANNSNKESQIDYTNIVAIIVNDNLYNNNKIKQDIERYATKYIQGKGDKKHTAISNSKALIFPINIENFSAKNIVQLLENIYFDGLEKESSRLVGLVLIGDIPLPVVNQDGYIFPTIYPYVDFQEQKFIWDDDSKYFVYNNNPNGQAEIWHGMINFGEEITEYVEYFNKLRDYYDNPENYIGKAIWYEDFIGNNKYFNGDSLNFYLNNFIFAEDIGYHRYSDLMVKVLQGQRNSEIAELMEGLAEVGSGVDLSSGNDALANLSDNMNTPTMQIKSLLDNGYLASYSNLFGQKYLKTITNNIETANRWIETRTGLDGNPFYLNAFDAVYKKAELTDEILLRTEGGIEPFLIMVNNALEEAVDNKVEQEKYRLNEVIPLTYLQYSGVNKGRRWAWGDYNAYENFFFGTNAKNIQNMEETSTYRGTFRNYLGIDGVTISDIQNSENPSTDIPGLDLNKKSIGGSYEIFAQQVDANRGYNYNNTVEELAIYSGNKTAKIENWGVTCTYRLFWICWRKRWNISTKHGSGCDLSEGGDQGGCEEPTEYALRVRGGASPLNLDINGTNFSWKSGYSYTGAVNPIFDIAGSNALSFNSPEYQSNSFESVKKYSNLTLRKFSPKTDKIKHKAGNPSKKDPAPFGLGYDYSMDYDVMFTNRIPIFDEEDDEIIIERTGKASKTASSVDFFDNYNSSLGSKEGNIIKLQRNDQGVGGGYKGKGEIYTYRTLDSRVKNDSVDEDELNGKTYKMFEDVSSPVKQFYDRLVDYIDSVSGNINLFAGSDVGSLPNKIITLKSKIDYINTNLDDIASYSGDINSGNANDLVTQRGNVFSTSVVSGLNSDIQEIQDLISDLSGFVDGVPSLFLGITEFIDREINNFKVNQWNLIFLNRWKINLSGEIHNLIDSLSNLKANIELSENRYSNISDINYSNQIKGNIVNKRESLNSGSGCMPGCETLCTVLDDILSNYGKDNIDAINYEKTYMPQYDDEGNVITNWRNRVEIEEVLDDLSDSDIFDDISNDSDRLFSSIYSYIKVIPSTGNEELLGFIPGLNQTTTDRPIDSPRYLTFKGIGGGKVTFIYPDIYKSEIFSGDSNVLVLKSTGDIKNAIISYLKGVTSQYNKYLRKELNTHNTYYNGKKEAFDLLNTLDHLASPNHSGDDVRPYNLFDDNYLIDWLENSIRTSPYFSGDELANSDPIGFIASMIYYQNVTRQAKSISGTIQGDFDNQRMDYDINEKVSYLMDNYLVIDNDQGDYLTPDYRTGGYEVAFINSNGNDRILYENTPDIVQTLNSASTNYTIPRINETDLLPLEEELLTECNIPIDDGVLIFQLSGGKIETPWFDALECRWQKIKEKPLEFKITFPFTRDLGASFWENLGNIFNWDEYQNIGETYETYAKQIQLLDMDDANNDTLSKMEESNPVDMVKLQEIMSYTLVNPKKSTISADNPEGEIDITSSKQLGNVEFKFVNVGASKIGLYDGSGTISNSITIGTGGFNTGTVVFDPYNQRILNFHIDNPIEGLNVVVVYLCLPGTDYCVKKSFRLDIVPGEIKNVKIDLDRHLVLEGASVPFKVRGTDRFGNKIGELVSQKFETFVDSGLLALNGVKGQSIKFSNFNKTNFSLIATGGDLDGKTISINVSGSIDEVPGVKATESVNVIRGRLDTYSGNTKLTSGSDIIAGLEIQLPDKDIYYTNGQPNTGTLPHITLKLVDKNSNILNIDGEVSIRTKNNRLTPGNIVQKDLGNGATQYNFKKAKTFELSGGTCIIYLSPDFSAGDEVIYISMEGVDSIELPVIIKHASAKVLGLSADKTLLNPNSSTDASVKAFDNWGNIVDDETVSIALGVANDKVSISKMGNIEILTGSCDFKIYSTDKGGIGYIYAYIRTLPMSQQSPAILTITIQEKMLPEEDLNVMYLNLFGNDRGNQRGYMSDNEKYSESLIKNSDKLITITTQLLGLENIKYYPVIINSGLQINNIIGNDIRFRLSSGFVFTIDEVGKISVKTNGFSLGEVRISEDMLEEYIESTTTTGTYKNKNVLLYIPEQTDSIIEGNEVLDRAIYINGHKIFDIQSNTFNQNLTISLGDEKIAGYQVWQVYYDENFIGRMIFAVGKKDAVSINLISQSPEYGVGSTWINGTSKEYGLGFYEIESSLPTKAFGYKSIQDSYNSMLGIGFTADFKNITNFGGGMSVGEATLPFGSELLINIGDPLLKRVDGNESAKIYDDSGSIVKDTEFDLGLGEVIYSDPNKEIYKVLDIDFNNDDLKDIIVIYKDGTVNILKNYGGTNPFQNLGALMTLADRISDVSAGDVDGNGYEDLLIWTQGGILRVYLNHKGIFDVDGYPVCINVNVDNGEISEHPEKISGIHQIFLRDMDLDGALDIVTNDKLGFIKIFYGGTTNGTINYVSTSKYMCDDAWYDRVQSNSKIVYQFGIKIDSDSHILDQSLIRWKGMSGEWTGDNLTAEDVGIDGNIDTGSISLDNIGDLLSNITKFDVSAATTAYQQGERYKQAGFGIIPVYESGIDNEGDINYVEIGALTGTDPVKIYKIYEDMNHNPIESNIIDTTGSLVDGDIIRVTVYITANEDFVGTFIDRISGPWIIPLSEHNEDMFENFWFDPDYITRGYITSGQIDNIIPYTHWDLGNARYMLDNINMKKGDRLKFSYGLIYTQYNSFDINVDTLTGNNFSGVVSPTENLNRFSNDKFPDISIQPVDGCNDSMFIFFNNGSSSRDYSQKFMDLGILVEEYNSNSQSNYEGTIAGTTQSLTSGVASGDSQQVFSTVSELAGGLRETIDWKGMLSTQGVDLSNLINLPNQYIDALTSNAVKKIDDIIGSACKGFSIGSLGLDGGGGCGLPIPFNQAFLGVGKYHIFGCYEIKPLTKTIGKGIPILNIPTTYGTYPGPGFFGLPTKVEEVDTYFLGAPSGTYPSMFRLYLMPTLTLDLGFALCFGPQTLGDNIPDPFASIVGNCVVFSVDLCGKSGGEGAGSNSTPNIPDEYTYLRGCQKQNNPAYLMPGESGSPFVFVGSSSNSHSFQPIIPGGSYAGGFINIEISPESALNYQESSSMDLDAIILEGGAKIQNKIQGSKEQGLIDKIVKQWLDKQIKYIMTNLTNFKISVVWPDLEALLGKTSSSSDAQKQDLEQKKKDCEKQLGERVEGEAAKDSCNGTSYCCKDTEASKKLKCENRGKQRDSKNKKCVKKISQNFEDESLASIDTWTQQNLLSREQISSRSEYTNPFKELEDAFSKTPLVNISTQDITVNIPMLTSEDITSYISMSQSRVNRQKEILEDWQSFFKSLIGVCGGKTNINGISDLGNAINDLKEQYKESNAYSQGTSGDNQLLQNLQGKIDALENLKRNYNLSDLGDYNLYEAKDGGFYVYVKYSTINTITPYDVYLYFNPSSSNLSMFTSGFDLIISNASKNSNTGKSKISIERNNQPISNEGLAIKKDSERINHSCAEIFLDGTVDNALKGFLNVQSSADSLMFSVKENIETLQQYKLFPLQLYDWIHVGERYLGDISNLLNSTLGTLSIWMETNANRYSQYIDAIITIMTTLETYQLIIDLSADWTENCSTCTNDNYDQFSCRLGKICDMLDIELPVIEIPSTKIPSIYLDFSEIHIETDIKLPNFVFNPISIPLPELPTLPSPPKIDLSLNLDEAISMGMGTDFIKQIKLVDFNQISSISLGNIPLIPSPPNLPDLPSFIPEIEMELPLLPPAPKIPELPNTITTAVKAAKIIGKILCIVKGKFGLVGENAIKAKVEQITQRDYEIPLFDNYDLTFSDWNAKTSAKLPSALSKIFTGFFAIMQTDQFKDVQLKGFDISLQTYINLQFTFDEFYTFLESVVSQINGVSYNYITSNINKGISYVSNKSKEFTDKLQACTNNPISVECNPDAAELIKRYQELKDSVSKYKKLLETSFTGIGTVLTDIENKTNRIDTLHEEIDTLTSELDKNNTSLSEYQTKLNVTYDEIDRGIILDRIEYTMRIINNIQEEINSKNGEITTLEQQISILNAEYGEIIEQYNQLKAVYETLSEQLGSLKNHLLQQGQKIIDQVNQEIKEAGENIDFEQLNQINKNINSGQVEMDAQKERDKTRRSENLQDLYREIDGAISYVDYDPRINENNINILKQTLSQIKNETKNKDIKDRAQESISLITMNKTINANTDSINEVQMKYNTIIDDYKNHNDEIIDLIGNDYDKFVAAVSDKKTSLVSDKSLDITLSADLFNMDKDAINVLSSQENWIKKYMDYNMKNVQGYLNAMENYDAESLNMSDNEYNLSKSYLKNIKSLSEKVYDIIDDEGVADNKGSNNPVLLAQGVGGGNNGGGSASSSSSTVDIANYIQGQFINTKEGNFVLANKDYVKEFYSSFLLTDINGDNHSDLILWDQHNVYIKYRKDNSDYDNKKYNNSSYVYKLESLEKLQSDAKNGFVKVGGVNVKLVDSDREVKNFKHIGQTFDTIKVSRSNSRIVGDEVDGYLIRMIHRVDQFNDLENLINQGNNDELFDKKYILALPQGSVITGTKLKLEKETLSNIETWIGTGNTIFSLLYYNEGDRTINLTVADLPRNWQYSEIYTLTFNDNTYKISSSSSNQVVAGPQIIADTQGPDPDIKLYRPATDKVVSEGPSLQGYVGTNYILQIDWEDNVAMDEMWIFDEYGETLAVEQNVNNQTGYIELSGLYFTGSQSLTYYILGTDIDGNRYSTDVNLVIKAPSIEITNILQGNQNLTYTNGIVGFTPMNIGNNIPAIGNDISTIGDSETVVTVVAELEHDIDSGFVQFFNNRNNTVLQLLKGIVGSQGFSITSFEVEPGMNTVYGGNFSIGNDIGLYSVSGNMVATINPKNGKITVTPGYQNIQIKLDYSAKRPIIKVMEGDKIIFWIIFSGEELVGVTTNSNSVSVENLDNENFGDFNGGKAVIRNGEVLLYVSPKGDIYTEATLYGEYSFDDTTQSVVYSFRATPSGSNLGSVKLKIKNLLEY